MNNIWNFMPKLHQKGSQSWTSFHTNRRGEIDLGTPFWHLFVKVKSETLKPTQDPNVPLRKKAVDSGLAEEADNQF